MKKYPWLAGCLWAGIFGLAAAVAVAIVMIRAIERSTSSTAGVGCFFIPFYALPFALVSGLWGLSIYGTWAGIRRRAHPALAIVSGLVAIGIPATAVANVVPVLEFQSAVNAAHRMNAEELESAFASSPWRSNPFFLGAIAQNKAANPELLDRIASLSDPELFKAMGTWWDVMGENRKGLAVMRLVAGNPRASISTIEKLAANPLADDYLLGDILGDPRTPLPILRRHGATDNYLKKWGLARNPNTPRDILERLARDPDEYTSRPAQENLRGR